MPGIMATRTISDHKDRLTTILIAPLMTCSARLPVYTLIIAAFIPNRTVGWGIGLQGLVLFVLYVTGIVGALVAALVLRRSVTKGKSRSEEHTSEFQSLMRISYAVFCLKKKKKKNIEHSISRDSMIQTYSVDADV